MRTIEWNSTTGELRIIDQRVLPGRLEWLTCRTPESVAESIQNMAVRGAPAIGVSAAFGVALAALHSSGRTLEAVRKEVVAAAELLRASRPTAVNLAWGLKRMLAAAAQPVQSVAELAETLVAEACQIAEEDVAINQRMGAHGAALIQDGDTIIHHCNTGGLAAVDWGTALGVIRTAHEQGKRIHVLVDETRPRLQGGRLTAWELEQYGISYEVISDNAAGYFLRTGRATRVFYGADRVAANGDVANKIGSYMLALAAHANGVPVYSVFPISTVDLSLAHGDLIPIEMRDASEVLDLQVGGQPVYPAGAHALNPAFDVTPHHLLTALITENGIVYPPFHLNLSKNVLLTPAA